MDELKKELQNLFEMMLQNVDKFTSSSYSDVFQEYYKKYQPLFDLIGNRLQEGSDEEQEQLMHELSLVIPEYAKEKLNGVSRSKKGRLEVDYNMCMAVYIIPMLSYTKNEQCTALAEQIVDTWNQEKITSLTLGRSDYETISGGFPRKLFGLINI